MAICADLEFFMSTATAVRLTVYSGSALAGDITGWTFLLSAKKNFSDTSAALTLTSGSGITIVDAANSVIELDFSRSGTAIATGTYHYDLMRTNSGAEDVLRYGDLRIFPNAAA